MATKHSNNGACPRCQELLDWVDGTLRSWFEQTQKDDPELHTSEGYRSKADQNSDFLGGKSKAKYGHSPHNYKPVMAIDVFWVINGKYNGGFDYPMVLAKYKTLAMQLPDDLESGVNFPNGQKDGPHVQVRDWKTKVTGFPSGA